MTQYTNLRNAKAIVVPAPDNKLSFPELNPPTTSFCSTGTDELVTAVPNEDGTATVTCRPNPHSPEKTIATETKLKNAIQRAATQQDIKVEMARDQATGLYNISLVGSESGGLFVQNGDHFPFHITHTGRQASTDQQYRISAPNAETETNQSYYTLETRVGERDWRCAHTVDGHVQPSTALLQFAKIAKLNIWTPDMDLSLPEYAHSVQEHAQTAPSTDGF